MKKILNKIEIWWWNKFGFHLYMCKLKKKVKKNSIINVYSDVD